MFYPIDASPENKLMGFFQGYFDESGKYQTQKVVSFCGFLESDWSAFEEQWDYLLRRNKLANLHVSKDDLNASSERITMYRQFIHAIKKTVEHGFAMAIDVRAFESWHKVMRSAYRNDPHFVVFQVVLRDVIKYASALPEPSVSVICDDEPSKACECYKMYDVMRQNVKQPENRKVLKSITFADANFYRQLQAADLFSWVSRAESLYRFFGEEYSLRELYSEFVMAGDDFRTRFTSGFWDAAHLKEVETKSLPKLKLKSTKP
jgi:hypothetical protein